VSTSLQMEDPGSAELKVASSTIFSRPKWSLEARGLGSEKDWQGCGLAVWLWAGNLTSLHLNFLSFKIGIIQRPLSHWSF
jgi:hypothetical protein